MSAYPTLVVPTPTPSNCANEDASSNVIGVVSPRERVPVNLVGFTSVSAPVILTKLSSKYIP